jgi:ethanolamine utilization protein EutQ (cupin superfamily)
MSQSMPLLFRRSDLKPAMSPRGTFLAEYVNGEQGAAMAGGMVVFDNADFTMTLWYDELFVPLDIATELEVRTPGQRFQMSPGDVLWLPAGTEVGYKSVGRSLIFYAVTPADWRKELSSKVPGAS